MFSSISLQKTKFYVVVRNRTMPKSRFSELLGELPNDENARVYLKQNDNILSSYNIQKRSLLYIQFA